MIDACTCFVNLHATPCGALLRQAGFPPALAAFVAETLDATVDDDPAFEGLAAEGGIELAPAIAELERRVDPIEAFIARVPASMAGSRRLGEVVGVPALRRAAAERRAKDAARRRSARPAGGKASRRKGRARPTPPAERSAELEALATALRAATRGAGARRAFAAVMGWRFGERALAGDALARDRGLVLAVSHGIDVEHGLRSAPRVALGRQMARSRALAEAAAGGLVGFVPFDACRPQGVGFVREALSRGLVGMAVGAALPRGVGDTGDGGPRGREARLLEALQRCRELDAPVAVHGDGAPWAPRMAGFTDRVVHGTWEDRLTHRRLAGLRTCLVVHELRRGPARGPQALLGSEALWALRRAATLPSVWAALPAEALLRPGAAAVLRKILSDQPTLAARVMLHGLVERDLDVAAIGAVIDSELREWREALRRDSALAWLELPSFVQRCGRVLGEEERRGLEALAGRDGAAPRVRRGSAERRSPAGTRRRAGLGVRASGTRRRGGDAAARSAAGGSRWQCDCLVLGAGIAGVTAADRLAFPRSWRDEPRSVIVVEAADRIGGRIHTLREGFDGPIELGAELIHRPESDQLLGGFTLWRDVKRFGLPTRSIKKLQASHVYFPRWKSNGPALRAGCGICTDPDVAKALDVLDRIAAWNVRSASPDVEAREFLEQRLAELPDPRDNAEAMAGLLLTGTVAGRLGETSVAGLASDEVKDQEMSTEEYHVGVGYDALVEAMASRLDVRLGFEVVRIAWGPRGPFGGVEVTAASGEKLTGRSALCTFSVGVLKHALATGSIVFDPPLPQEKIDALGRLENGPISKIVMRFRERFWPAEMSILGNPGQRRGGRSYFVPFFGVPGAPPALTGLFNGEEARELDACMEGLAEASSAQLAAMPPTARDRVVDFIENRVVADLRDIFLGVNGAAPPLERWHVRSWANDPRTRGGTSFIRFEPGARSAEIAEIRATLADHRTTLPLYWAGEATAVGTNPWSVHGAHQSGADAALSLQSFLELPPPP